MIDKWRKLLEPVVKNSLTPMSWDEVKNQKYVLFEGKQSVIVANDGAFAGKKALQLWLAAGEMDEVSSLYLQAQDYAMQNGYEAITYCGRRGWIKSHGFKEIAVVAVKELI